MTHKEADEPHDHEAQSRADGDLVELCTEVSVDQVLFAAMSRGATEHHCLRSCKYDVVSLRPRRSGFVHRLTSRTLFLPNSFRGVTTLSMAVTATRPAQAGTLQGGANSSCFDLCNAARESAPLQSGACTVQPISWKEG